MAPRRERFPVRHRRESGFERQIPDNSCAGYPLATWKQDLRWVYRYQGLAHCDLQSPELNPGGALSDSINEVRRMLVD